LGSLVQTGPYGLVRHPLYLAYLLADIGFNCGEWNGGTVLLTTGGWAMLLYRIRAEERILAQDDGRVAYVRAVHFRLLPQGSSWFPLHICGVKPTLPRTYQLKE
jgi:protein-S-isoprenylcysteine O-methyltransferase Ste14